MNSFDNRRLPRHKLRIVVFIFMGIVLVYAALVIFYPKRLGSPTADQQDSTSLIISPESKPEPTTQTPAEMPLPTPITVTDYSLPPVENGMVPVISSIATDQKVVFLGIDDGAFKDQSVIDMMEKNHIKASLFLSKSFISGNPVFFSSLIAQGSIVENHTLTHNTQMVKEQTYDQQKSEICGMADYIQQQFGRRPIFFRPPGGAYSDTMRQAAADCGMKAIITWIAKANGGSMQYQIGDKLRPGDIVLMHFRPEFKQDMQAFIDAMITAGLQTELLEDLL